MTPRPPRTRWRPRAGRLLSLAAAPLLAVPLIMTAASGNASEGAGSQPAITELEAADDTAASHPITLVTGDQVVLRPAGDGRQVAVVEAAPRASGLQPEFEIIEDDDALYVTPSDAMALIPDRLDPELFNVTKLAEYGYDQGVPVIVTGTPQRRAAAVPEGLAGAVSLPSVDGYAATVEPGGDWWSAVASAAAPPGRFATTAVAGASKVWLDELAEVSLAESVPMTGAPEAWDAGFDGAGTTVAVLDSGIDVDHPDLAGQVVGTRNFTSEADVADGHGHGTHVAATVAGTGAGADGRYTGVAPGADLLIGKICTSSGSCPNSATIAGMEWAAQNADVVSISIGTSTGNDGSAPTAQAVDVLTEQYDTLFVIAAANNGQQGEGSIGSPGAADAALTVGAVDKNGDLASFSSRGPRLGDFAVKPDITAPGVGIVAARAAGTAMGTPVDTLYTQANGTSMATPHVAGAAAIVLQQDPGLGADELKALLASTATPNPDLTIYEQGGGLVNVPAALDAPVLASPAPLNLGFFPYGEQAQPVAKTVTYTNRTGADVTLALALDVTHDDGAAAPEALLSVSPSSVTVPAGGTTTTTVTLDPVGARAGSYGGYLTATSGDVQVHTPVGFHQEGEMYDVVINGITRDGRPADTRSQLHVRHALDWNVFAQNSVRFVDGVARLRVPPGPYYLGGAISTVDGDDTLAQDRTMVAIPTLDVTGDTTVTLDAREAGEITFDTPEHPDARPHDNSRVVLHQESEQDGHLTATWLGVWGRTYALPAGPPAVGGEFELYVNARVGDAPLVLEMVEPERAELHPRAMAGSPLPDTDRELDVAYARSGAESDYAGLDVEGKAVMVDRAADLVAQESVARAHGAAALLVANHTTGVFSGRVTGAGIPALAMSGEEGDLIRDRLAAGGVTVRLAGTPQSSYLYDVFATWQDEIPADLRHSVDIADMMTRKNTFHGDPGQAMGEYRAAWRPYMTTAPVQASGVLGATTRTEYVTADDTLFRQDVSAHSPLEGSIKERDTYHEPGDRQAQEWFEGPMRPGILEPRLPLNPGSPVTRSGDTITMQLMEWWDADGHYGTYDTPSDAGEFRLYRDGVQVGRADWPRVSIRNLDPEPRTYRFEVDMSRQADWWPTSTATSTAWTIESGRPDGREVLPFLQIDYDIDLEPTNTAVHPSDRRGPAFLELDVRHQAGADGGEIARPHVWISYDDGRTWARRPVRDLGGGAFEALMDFPNRVDAPTGFVSLKVEAWDGDGNRVEQEVTRAWRLPAQ